MTTRSEPTDIAVDGTRLAGTVLAPGSTIPGVLFVHGWGGSQERDLNRAQQLAALGCICLTFDMRGHVRTEALRQTVTREQNLADVVAAYDHLLTQPHVDPNAILVVGASYGGYLAAILTSLRPVKWLALRVPALYKDEAWNHPKRSLSRKELDAYRSRVLAPDDNRALRACRDFTGDVLIVESGHDHLVPPPAIVSYRNAFQRTHSLTYRVIDEADHALSSPDCQRAYTSVLLAWTTEMVFGARAGGVSRLAGAYRPVPRSDAVT
ncbi:alpha/beta hydrolase [Fulvimonas yonginensis]|uniref:Alpha/beta hydrolase n=1 Tax=Fulvimonas yonginensis TaxID=1495200 RepID=A0ABU8JF37_9GAMM